jgi:hypothetical protein
MSETTVRRVVVPLVAEQSIEFAWQRVTESYGIDGLRQPWMSVETTDKEDEAEDPVSAIMLWPERADEVLMLLRDARQYEDPEDFRAFSTAASRIRKATGITDPISIEAWLQRHAASIADGFGQRPDLPPVRYAGESAPRSRPKRQAARSGAEIAAEVNAMRRGERAAVLERRPMPRWLFNIIVVVSFTGCGIIGLMIVSRCAT